MGSQDTTTGQCEGRPEGPDLDARFGAPKAPTQIKPFEKNPDGTFKLNGTLQVVQSGDPPSLEPVWIVGKDGREEVEVDRETDGRPQKLGQPTLVR